MDPSPGESARPDEGAGAELSDWRRRVLDITLGVTAALAGIAYVPGVFAAWSSGLISVVVVDTVAVFVLLALTFFRSMPHALRALGFAGLLYLLGIFLVLEIGPAGAGVLWILAFPVITAILYGPRGAWVALAITTATLVAGGFLAVRGGVGPSGPNLDFRYDTVSWVATSASLLFLGAVLSFSIAYLIRSLENALSEARASRREVVDTNRDLQREMEDRRILEAQLLRSQKMEALGTLAGGIAHDFNNLLVPILLETNELIERAPPGSPEKDSLDAVYASASRARDLVRGILAYSRGVQSERTTVDVDGVVEEVGVLLRRTRPASIGVEVRTGAGGRRVLANASELHQVLMNLGTNAMAAMEGTLGTVSFSTRLDEESSDDPLHAGAVSLVVEVRDTGLGMSPEILDRAFDPFFTTRSPGRGTGLGLAISHRIISSMDGVLELESTPGKGTVARIRLPVPGDAVDEVRVETPPTAQAAAPPLARPRLLFVDDEDLVRRTTRMVLERMGYEVCEAASPEAALRCVVEEGDTLDLVITDQTMPGMTGIDLAARMRELRPTLPILVSSGYLDDGALARIQDLELQGVLNKPYDRDELQAGIDHALQWAPTQNHPHD